MKKCKVTPAWARGAEPWTWDEITDMSSFDDQCNRLAKLYGEIGGVALELAHRMAFSVYEDGVPVGNPSCELGPMCEPGRCAMCDQWHATWSFKRLLSHYKKLYKKEYGLFFCYRLQRRRRRKESKDE